MAFVRIKPEILREAQQWKRISGFTTRTKSISDMILK